MPNFKPKIFVGSSSEARDVAEQFCLNLGNEATPIPWWLAPEFQAMFSTLDGLLKACNQYDFGLFIMTPDDKFESRGKKGFSARDNVLFELGLFLGALGPERVFAVIQENDNTKKQVKIPVDLLGITIPRFIKKDNYTTISSINTACSQLLPIIRKRGPNPKRFRLIKGWSFNLNTLTFSVTLPAVRLDKHRDELTDKTLILVMWKDDDSIEFENDTKIVIGNPRKLSRFDMQDLVLRVDGSNSSIDIKEGDVVWGYLLLAPTNIDFNRAKTINEMIDQGCYLLEGKGRRAED
jgi:hypothetical protein